MYFNFRKYTFNLNEKHNNKATEKDSPVRFVAVLAIKQLSRDFLVRYDKYFTCLSCFDAYLTRRKARGVSLQNVCHITFGTVRKVRHE